MDHSHGPLAKFRLPNNRPSTINLSLGSRDWRELFHYYFFCVGVMYSGEYDACDFSLSVYPHRAGLKNMPDHGGSIIYFTINSVFVDEQ